MHAWNLSTGDAEAGGLYKHEESLGYVRRSCLKQTNTEEKKRKEKKLFSDQGETLT